jgi:hypothetical protein
MNLPDPTPTREEAREIAVHDAHNDLRDNMLAIVYSRPDGAKIREAIDTRRAELFVELDTASLRFTVWLRTSKPILIMDADLAEDAAAADLRESLGRAIATTISTEPDEVQQRLVTLKNDGADYIVQLRELGTTKGFGMFLVHGGQIVWSPRTATPFDDRVTRPTPR